MTNSAALRELVHEMRNELAVVKANLEGLIDGKLEPSQTRFMSILQALDQLQALIGSLHEVEGSVDSTSLPVALNVCELLDREFAAMQPVAAAKNLTVSIDRCAVPAAQCMHFHGDPTRIGQIVKNVLMNAIRYTPAGGSIAIDCRRRADQLEVCISDSGPGISEQERERIFEPGFRGEAAAQTDGSGYGLNIVRRFVVAQGGSITASAAWGGGAAFTVRLPGKVADVSVCAGCRAQHNQS